MAEKPMNSSADVSLGPPGIQVSHQDPTMHHIVEENVLHRLREHLHDDLVGLLALQAEGFRKELHDLRQDLQTRNSVYLTRLDEHYEVLHRLDWGHRLWLRLREWLHV